MVSGNGVFKILGETYPVSLNGSVPVYKVDGETALDGPIKATITKGIDKKSAIIGLFINPKTNDSIVSVTIGSISDKNGTAFAIFGQPTDLSKKVLQLIKNNNQPNKNGSNVKSQSNPIILSEKSMNTYVKNSSGTY